MRKNYSFLLIALIATLLFSGVSPLDAAAKKPTKAQQKAMADEVAHPEKYLRAFSPEVIRGGAFHRDALHYNIRNTAKYTTYTNVVWRIEVQDQKGKVLRIVLNDRGEDIYTPKAGQKAVFKDPDISVEEAQYCKFVLQSAAVVEEGK
ncbi:MAG: hypothetical protein LBO69_01505 [Ignavibacteria bacterium]|jgi:hypothetical protein|nr:hypothetical protein [Ignavibacteria bacterium]